MSRTMLGRPTPSPNLLAICHAARRGERLSPVFDEATRELCASGCREVAFAVPVRAGVPEPDSPHLPIHLVVRCRVQRTGYGYALEIDPVDAGLLTSIINIIDADCDVAQCRHFGEFHRSLQARDRLAKAEGDFEREVLNRRW